MSRPVNRARGHRFSRCERQYSHAPHVQPSHGTPTRSPGLALVAPGLVYLHAGLLAGGLDRADNLVSENARWIGDLDLAVEQVQVGAAYPACVHLQQQLSRPRLWYRQLHGSQRPSDSLEHHRLHEPI